jgi:indolepyruvate ferredoxin oxidoreductase
LRISLEARLEDRLAFFDASELARRVLGDSIFSNMMIFGAAWQMGLIPVSLAAIEQAIRMNGAAVDGNLRAFAIGRWAILHPGAAHAATASETAQTAELNPVEFRENHLVAHQGRRLARRYRRMLEGIADDTLRDAVARGYHKLLTYKDEYEVARLHLSTIKKARETFEGPFSVAYHLAPPLLSRSGPDGRAKKRRFGGWMSRGFRMLAPMKVLRGTPFDPFGYTEERRMERALIRQYEADMRSLLPAVTPRTRDQVIELALLPLSIRGFGPVKMANAEAAAKRREALLATIAAGGTPESLAAE